MWISRLFVLFMIYSFFGWVYESSFTTLMDGRWQNRGFLYGPCCPIYGVGAVLITQIAEKVGSMQNEPMPLWSIFLVSFVGSAVLEYVTSYTLEKLFHAIWWDYSRLPFNLNGRISLFTSLGFGFAGIFVIHVLAPLVESWVDMLSAIVIELMSLILMGVIGSDIALTATALVGFAEIVATAEESFNERMELLVRRAYRPALRRVTIFRIRNVDSARIKRLRERLSIKIQDIGKSISEKIGDFDQKNYEPVIKASICNGEQVVGFKNKHTGEFQEEQYIRSEADLEAFKKKYGLTNIRKEY